MPSGKGVTSVSNCCCTRTSLILFNRCFNFPVTCNLAEVPSKSASHILFHLGLEDWKELQSPDKYFFLSQGDISSLEVCIFNANLPRGSQETLFL